jgi:hypothetical protein
MVFRVKINPRQLQAAITNEAERASSNASRSLRRAAVRIRDLAKEYAPTDTGTLENAIDYGTVMGLNRRKSYVVFIDLGAIHPDGGTVADYARIMEEQLHPYGRKKGDIRFDLDTGSIAKAATGKQVGGKFLARAIKEGVKDMLENATMEVRKSLQSGRVIGIDNEQD